MFPNTSLCIISGFSQHLGCSILSSLQLGGAEGGADAGVTGGGVRKDN